MRGEDEPEIYTDNESKILKYRRILVGFYVLIPVFALLLINRPEVTKSPKFTIFDVYLIFIIILEFFFIFTVI